MAGESGQKSKRHTLKTVVGQLVAFSHVFNTKPRVAFMELMHDHQLCHIALRQHLALYKNLTMGKLYRVTHLHAKQILYSDGTAILILETTPESSFMLLLDSERMLPEPGFSTANYEGKVVESCASLGIYQLHDGVQLCLAFLMKHTDVPVPCVGQNVSVYNAHSWKNEADHKHHIVLCGRSSIIVHGQSQELTNSNCILTDINHSCTYNDLLWLKKQLVQVEEKFNSDFLTENGILSESVPQLQQTVLIRTVNILYPSKEKDIKQRSFSREFLLSPHRCVVLKSRTFAGMYATLNELWKWAANGYKPFSQSWNLHITHHTTGLVGFLSTSVSNGYWTLSDATQSLSCVPTGSKEDLITLHGAIVLLLKYAVVREEWQDLTFVYIHFAVKDAHVIHTGGLRREIAYRLKKETDVGMACHSGMCTSENGTECKQRLRNFSVENILGYDLLSKETVVPAKYAWVIVVLHKTTAAKISLNAPSMCCVLVRLMGPIHKVADDCHSTQHQYLLLTGKLLQFVPLLTINSTYLLCFPDSTPCHTLPQQCRLKQKLRVLPDVWGVCLPEESRFLLIGTQRPNFFYLKFNSYNVSDKNLSEEVEQKELVNVEGVIYDRLHVDVKYESEKTPSLPGYGIPGMKNIVLKLRAAPGCNGVSLYFTKWGCRAYPYGLVPGAQVCAMFVSKHESRSSSFTYFQTTEFTTIEVLHIPHTVDINTVSNTCSRPLASWGDICILGKDAEYAAAGSILWGTFSTIKILTLMATTSCSKCGSFFRSGCCVGCNLYPASPKLSVTAACCIEDSFGKILIFMKDDQVCQLLGLSKPYWDVLTKVISHDGSKIELPQSQWNPEDPIGKQVLQALLKTVEIRQLPFHILCRKMNVNKTDTMYADMPKLNCLQLQKPRPPFSFSVFKKGISQP